MHTDKPTEVEIDLDAAVVKISRGGHQVASMPWPLDRGEAGSAVARVHYEFLGQPSASRHGTAIGLRPSYPTRTISHRSVLGPSSTSTRTTGVSSRVPSTSLRPSTTRRSGVPPSEWRSWRRTEKSSFRFP